MLHQRGDGDRDRRGCDVEHYRIQQESTRAFHIGHVNVRVQQDGRYASHDIALGASLARLNLGTILQGSGAHVDLRGLLAPLGEPAPRLAYDDRSRRPAYHQRRELSRHRRRARPRRVQRQGHRPARRAEDRRAPVEPQPAARGRRRDRHQAGARDLRQRREMQPRRDDRPARCNRPLLPALARARRSHGAHAADSRVRRVDRRVGRSAGRAQSPRKAPGRALRNESHECRHRSVRRTDFDVERIRRDFPILHAAGQRQAAGVSRQRRFEPAPALR